MDVSIVVTVETYDPNQPAPAEVTPVAAEAPEEEIQITTGVPADEVMAHDRIDRSAGAVAVGPANRTDPPAPERMPAAPTVAEPPVDTSAPTQARVSPPLQTRVAAVMRVVLAEPGFGDRSRVLFGFDSAAITSDQRATIRGWADWLRAHPDWALRIEGHTDRQGPCIYNRWLGQQRADAARQILVDQGIDPGRLLTVSFGEDRPKFPGTSQAERVQNRRVFAEPMRPAEMRTYDPGLSPCPKTTIAWFSPDAATWRYLVVQYDLELASKSDQRPN